MAQWWRGGPAAERRVHQPFGCGVHFICPGLLCAAARRLQAHHLAFALAYVAFTMGATWLLSAPRYLAAALCCRARPPCLQSGPGRWRCALAALWRRPPCLPNICATGLCIEWQASKQKPRFQAGLSSLFLDDDFVGIFCDGFHIVAIGIMYGDNGMGNVVALCKAHTGID